MHIIFLYIYIYIYPGNAGGGSQGRPTTQSSEDTDFLRAHDVLRARYLYLFALKRHFFLFGSPPRCFCGSHGDIFGGRFACPWGYRPTIGHGSDF